MQEEKAPYKLPKKKANSERDRCIKQASSKCVAATKNVVIELLKGNNPDMSGLPSAELGDLFDKAYSLGLKHMDQMHNKVDVNKV